MSEIIIDFLPDGQVAELALVENLQRQDLTPLEEARAFKEMLDKGYTNAISWSPWRSCRGSGWSWNSLNPAGRSGSWTSLYRWSTIRPYVLPKCPHR